MSDVKTEDVTSMDSQYKKTVVVKGPGPRNLLDDAVISQAREPTEEELLAEAKSWGFNSFDEFCDAVTEAHDNAAREEAELNDELAELAADKR